MKKKLSLFTLLFFSLTFIKAQKNTDVINPEAINYNLIDKLFNEKLNELRKTKDASLLSPDVILTKAAQDQALYMTYNDTLTHVQKILDKKMPADRVKFYKGTHEGIGENCLYITLFTPFPIKGKTETYTVNTYQQAADEIFKSWKNSPLHFKNMIDPSYDAEGIAFGYNKEKKRLYVAQVFGLFPYSYNKKLEIYLKDYDIKPFSNSYCSAIKKENVDGIRVANRIYVQDNKVFLDIQNFAGFKKAFLQKDDKIAIDIVFKDQFVCEKNNRLNGSPYFDGLLLEPVKFTDVFKSNTGTNGRLNAFVCKLPDEVKGMDYQLNVVLIKSNCFCSYTYPVTVENQLYDLINMQPYWDTIPTYVERDSFKLVLNQKIPFERGKSTIEKTSLAKTEEILKTLGWYTKAIRLNAYSSVEGLEELNKDIQSKRAAIILEKLKQYIPKHIQPTVEAKENWDLFFEQIKNTHFQYLENYSKQRIKEVIRDSLKSKIEGLLEKERYSEFEIPLAGTYHHLSKADILSLGLMQSVNNNNYALAHAIQSRLINRYLNGDATLDHLSEYAFPKDTMITPFVVNLLAAKSINENSEEYTNTERLVALFKKFGSNKRAQYNFCVFAINHWALQGDTIIHPNRLFELVKKCAELAPPNAVNSLMLNYHLAAVSYYTEVNNYDLMSKNLNSIYELFKTTKLDENSSYKLALYFSHYNLVTWAVELLEPYVQQNKNANFLHLYLAAGAVTYHDNYPGIYKETLNAYSKLFPAQYHEWIRDEYQLMREDIYKDINCKKP